MTKSISFSALVPREWCSPAIEVEQMVTFLARLLHLFDVIAGTDMLAEVLVAEFPAVTCQFVRIRLAIEQLPVAHRLLHPVHGILRFEYVVPAHVLRSVQPSPKILVPAS